MARTPSRTTGPVNRTPQPLPRRRTPGDFAKAFFAFFALLGLVVGVPAALAMSVGWPLPHRVPSLDMVQQQISVNVFVKILTLVVWLAWAQFTACVLVEVKAAVSGVGLPSRVPGAGPSQLLARQLIAAVLLITATAASFAPGLGQHGPQIENTHKPTVAAAQQLPGQQQAATVAEAMQQQAAAQAHAAMEAREHGGTEAGATKFYRIHPPEGRHHDSLWEVAERHLGDGRRYHEIYQLNKDRVQPDGSKLSEASLIRPGWIMEMPADAHGGDLVEMPTQAPEASPTLQQQIAEYAKSGDHAQPAEQGGGARAETPAAPSAVPERNTPAPTQEQAPQAATATSSESGFGLSDALIGAPLLAAGVLGALGRRRRMALWQSAMTAVAGRRGMEPPVPTGADADVHDALLVGADPEAVRFLDQALRGLSASLAGANRALPVVYAAWLTATELHLQLAQPSGEPPAPWRQGRDATLWSLERTAVYSGRTEPDAVAAPYPGLVSVGTLDGARLLLNLEAAPGSVSLSGPAGARAAVLSSVAAELATNGWSDRMTVTVVGFGRELGALAPTRLRHLDSVAVLLEDLGAEIQQRAVSARSGRSRLGPHRAYRPCPARPLGPAPRPDRRPPERDRGRRARRTDRRCEPAWASGAWSVSSSGSQLPGAAWDLTVTAAGRLAAPLLGLELTAQLLPAAVHDAVVRLFAAADAMPGPDGDDPTPAPHAFLVDISEQGRPAVYARLVGTYEIIGLHAPDDERSALLHEALALLLLHREGVHPLVLASAMWPRGVTDEVRDALLGRLRDWLGTDEDGSPRLRTDASGRLTLARSVVSDLDVLRSLHYEATEGPGARRASVRERLLTDALGLVRGPLLADRGRAPLRLARARDHRHPTAAPGSGCGTRALRPPQGTGHAGQGAIAALHTALASSPSDERLWNEILRATHATGDESRLLALVDDLAARSGPRGLPPRTDALLDELLPSWRGGTGPPRRPRADGTLVP